MSQLNGIIAFGLGGSASNAIVNEHSLAPVSDEERAHYCSNGIVALGLGSGANGLIINQHSLGYCSIDVEVIPVEPEIPEPVVPTTGGGGGGGWYRTTRRPRTYDDIVITLRTESNTWTKTVRVERNRTPAIIMIVGIINRITTNVRAKITSMRSLLSKIRIK